MIEDEVSNPPLLGDYLTLVQLAGELGKSPRTLERYFVARRGPRKTRIGSTILFKISDVHDWLDSLREPAAARETRRPR
jgi:hypothetical protein